MLKNSSFHKQNSISKLQKVLLFVFFLSWVSICNANQEQDLETLLSQGETLLNTTSSVQLEQMHDKIEASFHEEISPDVKSRYYNFNGNFASRNRQHSKAITYFEKGLQFAKQSKNKSLLLSNYVGFVVHYQANDLHEKALAYLEKILDLLKTTPNIQGNKSALAVVANFHRSIGNNRLEEEYINRCISQDGSFSPCLLLQGNFKTRTGNLSEGLKTLWSILLDDPEIHQMTTVFAIQTIIYNYISVSHFQKAEELIDLLLKKTQGIGLSMTSNFIALKADLHKEKGEYNQAKKEYIKAFNMYSGIQFRSEVLKSLFIVDLQSSNPNIDFQKYLDSGKASNKLINFEYSYDFVNTMNKLVLSSSQSEFNILMSFIQKGVLMNNSNILESDRGFVYDIVKRKAIEFGLNDLHLSYSKKKDSISIYDKLNRNQKTSELMNAQLGFYEQELFKSEQQIEEKDSTITEERQAKKEWVLYFILSFVGLLLVLSLFVQSIRNRRKIEKLSLELLHNNQMLKAYTEDYEFMLMTLSHHVKTPINQFFYGLQDLKRLAVGSKDENSNFILQTMTESTHELSQRLTTLLSFIQQRIQDDKKGFANIYLSLVLNEKTTSIPLVRLDIDSEEKENYSIYQHQESLEIILDNLIENAQKHGESGTPLLVNLKKDQEQIVLEFKNTIKSKDFKKFDSLQKNDMRRKGSFGLGFLIIQKLCSELNIEFSYQLESPYFYTKLIFHSS